MLHPENNLKTIIHEEFWFPREAYHKVAVENKVLQPLLLPCVLVISCRQYSQNSE